jgi:glutamate dehydrogenase
VGIADGSGVAEDPSGLDMTELLRLVEGDLPIAHFNPVSLSSAGIVQTADTLAGVKARNSMHLRVVSDAFIPAGGKLRAIIAWLSVSKGLVQHSRLYHDGRLIRCLGRPNTINEHNWHQYLQADGTPSATIIAEGANLFITPDAREHLSKVGLMAVSGHLYIPFPQEKAAHN